MKTDWMSIKAFARNDVWAFASSRAVYHYDESGWTQVTPRDPDPPEGFRMWIESPSYAISASLRGAIREWDGTRWTIDDENRNSLNAVSGVADSLWAVGNYGTILRRHQEVWREEPSGTRAHLNLVLATSADDAWAAGSERTLLHWNGKAWERTNYPSEHDLIALFGSDPNDVSAISNAAELFHWNGSSWRLASVAPVTGATASWGSSSSNAWIAERPRCLGEWCDVRLCHWDGERWDSNRHVGGHLFSLGAGWSSSANDVWIEGPQSLMHWDGSVWSTFPIRQWGRALRGDRSDNVWYFGWEVLLHWDGSQWSEVDVPTRQDGGGMWQSGNRIWLAGQNGMVLRGEP